MDPTQQAPYSEMMGTAQPNPQQMQVSPQYGPVMQPPPQDPGIQRPAANATEVEARKQGWAQVLQHPNFMRALGFMGAQMMQPIQPGQTRMGAFGQAAATGMTAFQLGEHAEYEKGLKDAESARQDQQTQANVRRLDAGSALEEARLPGVEADSAAAVATKEFKIETAKLALKNAKTDDEIKTIEKDLKQRKADIEKSIPDETLRRAKMAEIDAALLAGDEARARLKASQSAAKASDALAAGRNAEAGVQEITLATLKNMDEAERKEFLTKTKRYSQHTSGVQQQATMWGDIYDKLPADDPSKKGKTKEQFQMHQLTAAKSKDLVEQLNKYMMAGGDDPDVIKMMTDGIKAGLTSKAGTPTPAPGSGAVEWVRNKSTGRLERAKPAEAK